MNTVDCTIRRGVTADACALAVFAARTFAESYGADNRPEDIEAHLATAYGTPQQTSELNDPASVTLMAYSGEILVAYAQIRHSTPPSCVPQDHVVELHRFYVDRLAHGQGVAQRLMAAVHRVVHDFSAHHIWLGVWERNPRAIAFYKKEGFVDIGSTEFFVGPDRQSDRVFVAKARPVGERDNR